MFRFSYFFHIWKLFSSVPLFSLRKMSPPKAKNAMFRSRFEHAPLDTAIDALTTTILMFVYNNSRTRNNEAEAKSFQIRKEIKKAKHFLANLVLTVTLQSYLRNRSLLLGQCGHLYFNLPGVEHGLLFPAAAPLLYCNIIYYTMQRQSKL